MKIDKCDGCGVVVATNRLTKIPHSHVRISIDYSGRAARDLDLCEVCMEKYGLAKLIAKPDEPEPLLEALRELIREEIQDAG